MPKRHANSRLKTFLVRNVTSKRVLGHVNTFTRTSAKIQAKARYGLHISIEELSTLKYTDDLVNQQAHNEVAPENEDPEGI